MAPRQTADCNTRCWQLLNCAYEHCAFSDTPCVIQWCAAEIGGAAELARVGESARMLQKTFTACHCYRPTHPPQDDASL